MKIYDTLIIGSGYTSAGYAAAHPSVVICEEKQAADTSFCLPLSDFRYRHYEPRSDEGRRLFEIFDSLSLFDGAMQNTNGFEIALCSYLAERELQVVLKCRIISVQTRDDGIIDATVQTNEGMSHIYARKIIDTRPSGERRRLSVIFVTEDIESAKSELATLFDGAEIEDAFYARRYALHIEVNGMDENTVKPFIHERWQTLKTDAKILFIAPVFEIKATGGAMYDESYKNPVEAFEAGFFFEEGEGK